MQEANKLPNQASFTFEEGGPNSGEADIMLNQEEIGMIHANLDPTAEFDLTIEDQGGNVQFEEKGCKNPSGRWGKRISLPIVDSYYKVKLSNVKGAKSIDLFLE